MRKNTSKGLYTSAEAAKYHKISKQFLLSIKKRRGIEAMRVGNQWVYTLEQVKALKPGPHGVHPEGCTCAKQCRGGKRSGARAKP